MAANNNHFNLTLDTTKPVGSVSMVKEYTNSTSISVNITYTAHNGTTTDLGCATYMKCWINTNATGTSAEANAITNWEAPATSKTFTVSTQAIYYAHLVLLDEVGNQSAIINSGRCVFDNSKPTISTFTILDTTQVTGQPTNETNTLTNDVTVAFEDNLASVSKLRFSCADFSTNPTTIDITAASPWTGQLSFKEATVEGSKTITVVAIDKCGNESDSKATTIYYDPDARNVKLMLYKTDSTTSIVDNFYNSATVVAKIVMNGTYASHSDIVGYQIWGTTSITKDPGESGAWTSCTPAATISIGSVTFATGDGTKTLNIRVKDHVGNIYTTSASYKLDQTKPTITGAAVSKTRISNISGYNTSALTFTIGNPGTTNFISGIGYTVKINGGSDISVDNTTGAKTINITSSTAGMKANQNNSIVIYTYDAAGNSASTTVSLYLDTTAPTVTVVDPSGIGFGAATAKNTNDVGASSKWHNASTFTGVKLTSFSEACTGYFWLDQTTNTTTVPSGCGSKSLSVETTIGKADITGASSISESASENYLHIKLVDSVGNTTYYHNCIAYDSTAPTAPTAAFSAAAYNTTAASIKITYKGKDATAGTVSYKIDDVSTSTTVAGTWTSVVATADSLDASITMTSVEGVHKYNTYLKDAAGNVSAATQITCEYDSTAPTAGIILRNPGTTAAKNSPSNITSVDIAISITDDTLTSYGKGYYKIWGDFTGSAVNDSAASWVAFDGAGTNTITVNKTATTGDGTKTFHVIVKDNAGNLGEEKTASFTLDTEAPIVYASIDYNRISKVHELRRSSGSATISNNYCDQVIITAYIDSGSQTVSSEQYQAYKVCAYKDKTAAEAGTHNDASIGACSGSVVGSGKINITVTGSNLEKYFNNDEEVTDSSKDGVYILVVYIQDKAGTWSEAATF